MVSPAAMSLSTPSPMVMAAVRPEMPAPMMTICARTAGILEEKARVLHVVCEFNETAEPTRPSYALPATLKSEERRHERIQLKHAPLDLGEAFHKLAAQKGARAWSATPSGAPGGFKSKAPGFAGGYLPNIWANQRIVDARLQNDYLNLLEWLYCTDLRTRSIQRNTVPITY